MWALVFACEALCHSASIKLFESGLEEYEPLKDRAAAQISWAVGRLNYINNTNGIRQAAVFADHFRDRWAGNIASGNFYMTPVSPPQSSSYIYEMPLSPNDTEEDPI